MTTTSYHIPLEPWNEDDTSPPRPVAVTTNLDKITFAFDDEGTEFAIEIDQGQPRLLIYAPCSDGPVSIRWKGDRIAISTEGYTEDGGVLAPHDDSYNPPAPCARPIA